MRELWGPNGQSDRRNSRSTGMRVKVVQFIAIITTAHRRTFIRATVRIVG